MTTKEVEQQIDELITDYRKTCFLVAGDMQNDKAIDLMALSTVNIKSILTRLVNEGVK